MKRRTLTNVPDPQGRLDVLLYQFVARAADRLERERGIVGLREHLLPVVEEVILAHVPQRSLIPRELAAVLKVCEANRIKARGYV